MTVIFQLFGMGVSQSREPAHSHPHGEVLALDKTRADMRRIGIAVDHRALCAEADGRAVAFLAFRRSSVLFHQHCIVNRRAERAVHRAQISAVAVCS